MNYITYSTLTDNLVTGAGRRLGEDMAMTASSGLEGKALFIYNSLFNRIERKPVRAQHARHPSTAGSEDNRISDNAFINNRAGQNMYASRRQEWSVEGAATTGAIIWADRKRRWPGRGGLRTERQRGQAALFYPQVRLLMNSPGIEALRVGPSAPSHHQVARRRIATR